MLFRRFDERSAISLGLETDELKRSMEALDDVTQLFCYYVQADALESLDYASQAVLGKGRLIKHINALTANSVGGRRYDTVQHFSG